MEWVMTTGKTIDEAKERALDQLGIAGDEAEFEIVEEAKTGMFGRVKSEARVRARVRPAQVRQKHDRRERRRGKKGKDKHTGDGGSERQATVAVADDEGADVDAGHEVTADRGATDSIPTERSDHAGSGVRQRPRRQRQQKEQPPMDGDQEGDRVVSPDDVGAAAVSFMTGLTAAFGIEASAELTVDGTDLDVKVTGEELGLLVGPGGRTLAAIQDLARVASQRRLGDHDTRLRIDVAGYREKRKAALERFALAVAHQVAEQGHSKALEPMSSADRKAVHDAIAGVAGVTSRSEGSEPSRHVVIAPAEER